MSKPKHTRMRIDNGLNDLAASLAPAGGDMGGSNLSGYGTMAWSTNTALVTLNRILLAYSYANIGLLQTAVQLPIQDALAKGVKIESGELSPENIDEITDWLEDHKAFEHLENYWTWVRLFGGAGLVMNCDQDTSRPLNYRRLKGAPMEFYDVDRWQLTLTSIQEPDFLSYEDFQQADTLYLNGHPIERSHIILGSGKRAPSYIRRVLRGWGMSEAERMVRDLNVYLKTDDVLYEILDEAKIDVYKIKGFANKLATTGGTDAIRNRVQAANKIKNFLSALVLDSEEDFQQKNMTFTGLADVKRENRIGVASSLRMPMVKLFGLSASGFSTGESDLDNYNEMVESEIRAKIKPAMRQMIEFACWNLWGYCPSFRFSFPPLKVLPELDAAQIRESKANVIMSLFDRGLVSDGKAIGDELAKEEIISAELAARFIQNPIPPNGAQGVAPVETNSVSVIRKAQEGIQNAVDKFMKKKEARG